MNKCLKDEGYLEDILNRGQIEELRITGFNSKTGALVEL